MIKSHCALIFIALFVAVSAKECYNKKTNSKLFCYYGKARDIDSCKCSHVILPANSDIKSINDVRETASGTKILLTVNEFNEGLVNTLKKTTVDGLEIDLKKLDSKNDISDFMTTVRSKLGSDLYLAVAVPSRTETLAKYYDFKALSKNADVFIVQTHFLGASKNVTFHPSRLSGLWDVQNTDSVVDLISGLGAPLSKLVISTPVQGFKFTLQNEKHTAPGSPAVELSTLTRDQLCEKMSSDKWTLERDEDQAGPYIFRDKEWISFEDTTSIDIKAKYSRVRGLAGLALKDLSQDGGLKCGGLLLNAAFEGLSKQARAPRGAVLHSLEREILQTTRVSDNVQVSPYRISRVIDVEGKVHVIRQDTRTEFECSRQGYFVHPRSCGRFYRCVKFDQLSDEFSVFEFDCPAGLAFDNRVEVCVWPGSLPHASACSGSSEIAPVPKERFICPGEPGYYADPENCRWFFACLDHGKSPLSAYEFRCPYGLVFDQERLLCEWSWLVPKCSSGLAGHLRVDEYYFGHGGQTDLVLDHYNGLGSFNGVKLGGLQGPLVQPLQRTYSSSSLASDNIANVFGLQKDVQSGRFKEYDGIGSTLSKNGGINYGSKYNDFAGQSRGLQFGVEGTYGGGSFNQNSNVGGISLDAGNLHNDLIKTNSHALNSGLDGNTRIYGTQSGTYGSDNVGSQFGTAGSSGESLRKNGGGSFNENSNVGGISSNIGILNLHGDLTKTNSYALHSGLAGNTRIDGTQSGTYSSESVGSQFGTAGSSAESLHKKINSDFSSESKNFGNFNSGLFNQDYTFGGHHSESDNVQSSLHSLQGTSVEGYGLGDKFKLQTGNLNSESLGIQSGVDYNYEDKSHADFHVAAGHADGTLISGNSGQLGLHVIGGSGIDFGDKKSSSYSNDNTNSHTFSQVEHGLTEGQVQSRYGSKYNVHIGDISLKNIQSAGNSYSDISQTHFKHLDSNHKTQSNHNNFNVEIANKVVGAYDTSGQQIKNDAYSFSNTHHYNHAGQYAGKVHDTLGHVNIVAGGISGIAKDGVEITKHGFNLGAVEQVTPLSVVASSIPSVTSIPIPAGHSFEFYNGGVVANLPDLQYKLEHPSTINAYLSEFNTYKDIKAKELGFTNYTKFVSSTQNPLVIKSDVLTSGFNVVKANVGEVHTIKDSAEHGGYIYDKPTIQFEHQSKDYISPVVATYLPSTPSPTSVHIVPTTYAPPKVYLPSVNNAATSKIQFTQSTPQRSYVKPLKPAGGFKVGIVESHSFHKPIGGFAFSTPTFEQKTENLQPIRSYQEVTHNISPAVVHHEGYHYNKPHIAFEEVPAVSSVSHQNIKLDISKQEVKSAAADLIYEKPAIAFEEKRPASITYQEIKHNSQPAVNFQQNIKVEKKLEGYHYEKPSIAFEETPLALEREVAYQEILHEPAISYHHDVKVQQDKEYNYEKPAVIFEEKPVEKVHIQPAVTYQEIKHTVPIIKQEGYQYEKPAVVFEEKPVQKEHARPAVTYQEIKHAIQSTVHVKKEEGYHYEKPAVIFEEKPVDKVHQPAVTYQEIKHAFQPTVHTVEQEGYHYEKPAIAFEEKPVPIKVAATFGEKHVEKLHIQPTVTYQEIKQSIQTPVPIAIQEGYHYEKPAVIFEEKPAENVHIQPAVTYQEIKHAFQPNVHTVQQEGYHYEKPTVTFEEKPVPIKAPALAYQEIKHDVTPTIAVQLEKHEGYRYEKPIIQFEEKPQDHAVTYQQIKHNVQPAVTINVQKYEGYQYEKPTISFEERPTVTYQDIKHHIHPIAVEQHQSLTLEQKTQPAKPVIAHQEIKQNFEIENQGYHYDKPSIVFEEKPKVLIENVQPITYQEIKHEVKPTTAIKIEKIEGYHYEKPSVIFEEKPLIQIKPQPTPAYQETYHYENPKIHFEEKRVEHGSSENKEKQFSSYQEVRHEGIHYEHPIHFQEKPALVQPVVHIHQSEKVVTPIVEQKYEHKGYHYEKPAVIFEEKPQIKVQPTVAFQQIHIQQEQKPITHEVIYEQKPSYQEVLTQTSKPPVISTFSIDQFNYGKKVEVPQTISTHFSAPKPTITYIPAPQPTPSVAYLPAKKPIHSYVPAEQPAPTYAPVTQKTIVESYYPPKEEYVKSDYGYKYEKPEIKFELSTPKPSLESFVKNVEPVKEYTFVSYDSRLNQNFKKEEKKEQEIRINYSSEEEVSEEPIVAKKIPLDYGYKYPKPEIKFEEGFVVSTSKPYHKTEVKNIESTNDNGFISYDSRFDHEYTKKENAQYIVSSTPATLIYEKHTIQPSVKQSKPIVRYEFSSLDTRYQTATESPLIEKEYLPVKQPIISYLPVTSRIPSTRKPIVITTPKRTYLQVNTPKRVYLPTRTTTEQYVEVASPSREYLPETQEIYKIKTPKRVYLPVSTTEKYVPITTPTREYLPVTQKIYTIRTRPTTEKQTKEFIPVTRKPSRDYLPVTRKPTRVNLSVINKEYLPASVDEINKELREPSREYLPGTETPKLEYLPAKGSQQIENYQIADEYVATRRPKIVKIIKSKPIVKVNDFHPMLSAKLGAQCTCVSNTLTLRKTKPKPKALRIEEVATKAASDDDLSYVLDEANIDNGGIVLEDYKYEPKKIEDYEYDDDTINEPIVVSSTLKPPVKSVEVRVNKSGRTSVTVIRKKSRDQRPSKEQIADAVDIGLKLVKSAVKEGAREGVKEALESKNFDRYGPGGLRSRSETLQGTIECQRAGLFRHPKHCNKFYACRWDCDKKKFTLHVFNCPVYLTFDNNLGACNWPSQGPACVDNTLLPSV